MPSRQLISPYILVIQLVDLLLLRVVGCYLYRLILFALKSLHVHRLSRQQTLLLLTVIVLSFISCIHLVIDFLCRTHLTSALVQHVGTSIGVLFCFRHVLFFLNQMLQVAKILQVGTWLDGPLVQTLIHLKLMFRLGLLVDGHPDDLGLLIGHVLRDLFFVLSVGVVARNLAFVAVYHIHPELVLSAVETGVVIVLFKVLSNLPFDSLCLLMDESAEDLILVVGMLDHAAVGGEWTRRFISILRGMALLLNMLEHLLL